MDQPAPQPMSRILTSDLRGCLPVSLTPRRASANLGPNSGRFVHLRCRASSPSWSQLTPCPPGTSREAVASALTVVTIRGSGLRGRGCSFVRTSAAPAGDEYWRSEAARWATMISEQPVDPIIRGRSARSSRCVRPARCGQSARGQRMTATTLAVPQVNGDGLERAQTGGEQSLREVVGGNSCRGLLHASPLVSQDESVLWARRSEPREPTASGVVR